MKGQVYEITVSDGLMDAIHGGYYRIREIFVPEIGVVINERNIFTDKGRYKVEKNQKYLGRKPEPVLIQDIELDDSLRTNLITIIESQKLKENLMKTYTKTFKLPKCPDCKYGHNEVETKKQNKVVYCKTCNGHGSIWACETKEAEGQ